MIIFLGSSHGLFKDPLEFLKFNFVPINYNMNVARDENGAGRGGAEGGVFVPAPHGFILFHLHLALPRMTGKTFLTPSLPLGASQSPVPPRKTLLFINLPYN